MPRPRLGEDVDPSMTGAQMARNEEGRLLTYCWCEAVTLRLPVELVRRGLTASCGRKGCQRP